MIDEIVPRILAIFAHPDDETFCAGGTLAKYAAAGANVMVVCVTRGQSGQIRDATIATRATLGTVREREFQRACNQLGVRHALCLDYEDGTLQEVDQAVLVGEMVRLIRGFCPHAVITFDATGGYGHPDHVAVSQAVTEAYRVAGDPLQFPESGSRSTRAHRAAYLYHSLFVRGRILLLHELAHWLVQQETPYHGTEEAVQALSIFARESATLQYANDYVHVNWYPPGFYIIEQGETGDSLYLILSGEVDIIQEDPAGASQTVAHKGIGEFFGEMALAWRQPRNAHVVAVSGVTCLVLSASPPTAFAGRGSSARLTPGILPDAPEDTPQVEATTCIDVSQFIDQKMAALAAHRTQYPIPANIFPNEMLVKMFGQEYFKRIDPPVELETHLFTAGLQRSALTQIRCRPSEARERMT